MLLGGLVVVYALKGVFLYQAAMTVTGVFLTWLGGASFFLSWMCYRFRKRKRKWAGCCGGRGEGAGRGLGGGRAGRGGTGAPSAAARTAAPARLLSAELHPRLPPLAPHLYTINHIQFKSFESLCNLT